MNDLANQVKLNAAFNRIMDLADREGVQLEVFGSGKVPASLAILEGGKVVDRLYFNSAHRTTAYREDTPPYDYETFLNCATDLFVKKNTDYDSRFTRALMATTDPRFLWGWEVDKKVDRVRSWVARGELLVKGEGVSNSVYDIFNYTVLYVIFNSCKEKGIDPLKALSERDFYSTAGKFTAGDWIGLLETEGIIKQDDGEVKRVIAKFMGV